MVEPFICEMCLKVHLDGKTVCSEWCNPSSEKIESANVTDHET